MEVQCATAGSDLPTGCCSDTVSLAGNNPSVWTQGPQLLDAEQGPRKPLEDFPAPHGGCAGRRQYSEAFGKGRIGSCHHTAATLPQQQDKAMDTSSCQGQDDALVTSSKTPATATPKPTAPTKTRRRREGVNKSKRSGGPRCSVCGSPARFKPEGANKFIEGFCGQHAKAGMVDLRGPLCTMPGCMRDTAPVPKRATYAFPEEGKAKRCSEHRQEGMVDVVHKKEQSVPEVIMDLPPKRARGGTKRTKAMDEMAAARARARASRGTAAAAKAAGERGGVTGAGSLAMERHLADGLPPLPGDVSDHQHAHGRGYGHSSTEEGTSIQQQLVELQLLEEVGGFAAGDLLAGTCGGGSGDLEMFGSFSYPYLYQQPQHEQSVPPYPHSHSHSNSHSYSHQHQHQAATTTTTQIAHVGEDGGLGAGGETDQHHQGGLFSQDIGRMLTDASNLEARTRALQYFVENKTNASPQDVEIVAEMLQNDPEPYVRSVALDTLCCLGTQALPYMGNVVAILRRDSDSLMVSRAVYHLSTGIFRNQVPLFAREVVESLLACIQEQRIDSSQVETANSLLVFCMTQLEASGTNDNIGLTNMGL